MKKIMNWFGASMMVLLMAGCDIASDIATVYNHGGIKSAPATLSLNVGNIIEKNSFYNYFKYTAREGEKLDLHAVLDFAITASNRMECEQTGDTFIVVYDSGMHQLDWIRTCSANLTVEFPAAGRYIIQITYPGNEGYFDADSTMPQGATT
ncbi:MAG TPA: hypothetical protein ENL02_00160 [Epsilonproteobacteria bacterium]|nr:hypothetical protein [Campylobacterota bacterium]